MKDEKDVKFKENKLFVLGTYTCMKVSICKICSKQKETAIDVPVRHPK